MINWLSSWLEANMNLTEPYSIYVSNGIMLLEVLLAAWLLNLIIRLVIKRVVWQVTKRTRNTWDDIFFENQVFRRLSHIGPAILVYAFSGAFTFPWLQLTLERGALVYICICTVWFIDSLLVSVQTIYQHFPAARDRPIKGYLQGIKIVVVIVALIFAVSAILGQRPTMLLGTLGAFTAVLMLIFRDPILGIVAGIQLAGNNMVRVGDWVEVPHAGADGEVVDVTLTTVVVQNWNKTLTMIPIYLLVSKSFTNWRGMSESGGRRIKRALNVDISSIRFLDEALLEKLRGVALLQDYLAERLSAHKELRGQKALDDDDLINGPALTNVGVFRTYISKYLDDHPHINKDLTFLIRQLPPGDSGLPIEVYVFSGKQGWIEYENIQSDIFDHLLAVAPFFELSIFQKPAGGDVRALSGAGLAQR